MDLYLLSVGEVSKQFRPSATLKDPPLTDTSKKQLEVISDSIKALHLRFDLIILSPLTCARQTGRILCNSRCLDKRKIVSWDELVPEGNRNKLYVKFRTLNRESYILIISTRAYLTNIISDVISTASKKKNFQINLKNGGLAKIRLNSVHNFKGELRWLLSPKATETDIQIFTKRREIHAKNTNSTPFKHVDWLKIYSFLQALDT